MKIHADKIESGKPHSLRIRDVKLILGAIPPEWIDGLKEVRLANSLEFHSPKAFFSGYDGCLTVYSRTGTKKMALEAFLSALAAEAIGISRGRDRRSEAEKHRLDQVIQPIADKLLSAINPPKGVIHHA